VRQPDDEAATPDAHPAPTPEERPAGVGELLERVFQDINDRFLNPGTREVSTGLKERDDVEVRLRPGSLTVLAGRPALGKTSFGVTVARNLLLAPSPTPVAVVLTESTADAWLKHLLSAAAHVERSRVRTGRMSERDFQNLAEAAARLAEAPS